ncbi:O-antigen ligase family protein [Nitrosomonas oligotropha]|uniref:O-antigen ligase-related domain-containing protein n=1 Tax=Nitrosomonas oligotropha TaxID=42354 RepID=A0A1H8PJJ4_9PROT|nr:O-antigen ligase family protein [Nitrosomonas oligotropha]SDX40312.1 hypothetical protein SAMN05216300_1343 [Nitrosomonas oligotropha]SEO42199.1 hypothetical protein SAMN05216333_109115 [Nitrosomonas oligotropha]
MGGFTAGVLVAILPWAMKSLGVLILGMLGLRYLKHALRSLTVIIVFFFVAIALVSGIVNGAANITFAKYIFIAVGFTILASLVESSMQEQRSVLIGLLLASFVYCFFFIFHSDWARLHDPEYRGDVDYDVFLAQTAAVMAVISFRLMLTEKIARRYFVLFVIFFLIGIIFPYLIKSRGYTTVLIISIIYILYREVRMIWIAPTLVVFITSLLIFKEEAAALIIKLTEVYGIFDGVRDVTTGSGRFNAWEYALFELFPKHPWIGYGPDSNYELLWAATMINGGHNVLIATIVDFGLFGLAMLFALFYVVAVRAIKNEGNWFGLHILIIGVASILNENMLFTFGNPGSLLIMLSIASLGRGLKIQI